ncbi:hypothetical protein ACOSQ3_019874 [Xanthoceras sorbifolium]
MAYSHCKLMGAPLSAITGERDLLFSRPVTVAALPRHQENKAKKTQLFCSVGVRREGGRNLQAPKAVSVSRRDAMLCVTAEILSGIAMLSAEPAEARVTKLERRRKIMEKLEKIREKAGESKPKTEDKVDTTPAPTLLPRPQPQPQPLVEAILP